MLTQQQFEKFGYLVTGPLVCSDDCDEIIAQAQPLLSMENGRHGGIRNFFNRLPATRRLVRCENVRSVLQEVLSDECFAVRSILFDKTVESNWLVPWHQDRTIAVNQRIDISGFGPRITSSENNLNLEVDGTHDVNVVRYRRDTVSLFGLVWTK